MSSSPTFPSFNVVVVGSYNADLVLSCDPIPTLGESILAAEFNLYSGGRGANSAVAAARAGCQVTFVGAHGADLVFSQLEISPEGVAETVKLCSHYKKRLVLYASPVGPRTHLPDGEIFLTVLSIREALTVAETTDVSYAVSWLHDRGSQNLVLVDGDQSVTFSSGKAMDAVPIPRSRRVLYSGSVECLVSWTAIALLSTGDLARAAEIGATAMALSLSREGAQESMPYRSEVLGSE
jgi:sugar/nucleoside kinase (ribokinase family)